MTATAFRPTDCVETLLQQLGGANQIAAMTGVVFAYEDDAVTMVFRRQTGAAKLTHLKITYNRASDLYDLRWFRMNRKIYQMVELGVDTGVYAEDLRRICEDLTGLYFTLGTMGR